MRYFIGFLVTIGLIILLIVLLFGGGGGGKKVPNTRKTLPDYASTNAVVRVTIDGPINAQQNHQAIQVTVGKDETQFEVLHGYDNSVSQQQTFPNTQTSYDVFLHALDHVGYTRGNTDSALQDERGYCASGERYIFELQQDGKDVERFWATSCGSPKTYAGNVGQTLNLFEAQVPGFSNLVQNLNIGSAF